MNQIKELFIVKIGGSVITNKNDKFSVNETRLNDLVKEISSIDSRIILIHGGGSFGHPLASEYEIEKGYKRKEQLLGFSKTHQAMKELNSIFLDAFIEKGRPAVSVQTSACTKVSEGEIVSMELKNISQLLELGFLPILYGDCVLDMKRGIGILSGDQIATFLAQKLKAEKLIFGVDTKGVMTGDPQKKKNTELIPKITPETWKKMESFVKGQSGRDVTGGMRNKVEACIDLAKNVGIESGIINAKEPGNLRKAILTDKRIGTKIARE
ncbi:MAG: isopentenyl phosphate kinase [Candidatus Hadarchaeia archaeon]